MADVLTKTISATYDRLRDVRNLSSDLRLDKATATGYTQLGSDIKSGWYAEFTEDRTTGDQFLQVLLAESDAWTLTDLKTLAAAVVFNNLRYKINGKRKPEAAPLVWMLTCSATGEAVT